MALNGPTPLDEHDLAEVDRQHAAQESFLRNFEMEVTHFRTPVEIAAEPSGLALVEPLTAAQFVARAEMYGGSVWTGAAAVDRARVLNHVRKIGTPVKEARFHRKPDPERHACKTCLEESNRGFVPVGTLLPIGDPRCECKTSCDCYFVYELVDGRRFSTLSGMRKAG